MIMYLQHEIVELSFGELRFFVAGPRVLATNAPIFDAINTFAIVARVIDCARRAQQVDYQLRKDPGRSLQGWKCSRAQKGKREGLISKSDANRGGAWNSLSKRAMAVVCSVTTSA